jgi:hypothetical protein
MTGLDHWADLVADQAPVRFGIEDSDTNAVTQSPCAYELRSGSEEPKRGVFVPA